MTGATAGRPVLDGGSRPTRRALGVIGCLLALAFSVTAESHAGVETRGFPVTVDPSDAVRHSTLSPPADVQGPILTVDVEEREIPIPPDLTIHLLIQERDRAVTWRWRDGISRSGNEPVALVVGSTTEYSRCLLLAENQARTAYALSALFSCPRSDASRTILFEPRRTLAGPSPEGAFDDGSIPAWFAPAATGEGFAPYCQRGDSGDWQCVGIPADSAALILLRQIEPIVFSVVPAGETRPTPPFIAEWGVPVCLDRTSLGEGAVAVRNGDESLQVEVLQSNDTRGQFLDPDSAATVAALGRDCFWVGGSRPPGEETVRIRGEGLATLHLPADQLLTSGPVDPRTIGLLSPIWFAGTVTSADTDTLEGTLVELFTWRPQAEDREKDEPGFHLAETGTDADGGFVFEDLAPGTYYIRACHPLSGCAEGSFATDDKPPRLRLEAERLVRGRVTFSDTPLDGVLVRALPTAATYQNTEDPTRLLTPGTATDEGGTFVLALPATGTFRLAIESERFGSAYRLLGPMEEFPREVDLDEIRLSFPVHLDVSFPGCAEGRVVLIGPRDDPAALPAPLVVRLDSGAAGQIELPGSGLYLAVAECGSRSLEESLAPNSIEVPPDITDLSIVFEAVDEVALAP